MSKRIAWRITLTRTAYETNPDGSTNELARTQDSYIIDGLVLQRIKGLTPAQLIAIEAVQRFENVKARLVDRGFDPLTGEPI